MANHLTIPVLQELKTPIRKTGTAGLAGKVKKAAQVAISELPIDEASLGQCLLAAQTLLNRMEGKIKGAKPDSITFQLGISGTGKVGFMGTGVDVQVAASIQLTLKIS